MNTGKQNSKSRSHSPHITTEEFDAKFDAGEDITAYLDVEKIQIFCAGENSLEKLWDSDVKASLSSRRGGRCAQQESADGDVRTSCER